MTRAVADGISLSVKRERNARPVDSDSDQRSGPGVGPFALSDPERIRAVLDAAGFVEVTVVGNQAPMWFGADAADAHQFILGLMGWMLDGLEDDGRAQALDALRAVTVAHQTTDGVTFASATWITTARVG